MSTNCLVTKLKGIVNNNNLPKYGELLWRVSSNDVITIVFGVGQWKNANFEVTGDLSIWNYQETTNYGQTYHYESSSPTDTISIKIKGNNGDISFTDKYSMWDNLTKAVILYDTVYDNDIKSLKYWFKSTKLALNVFGGKSASQNKYVERTGTLNDIVEIGVPFTSIDIGYSKNITGNIATMAALKNTLTKFAAYGTSLSGSIEDLGECTLLVTLNFNSDFGIEGTVEGFVARQRAAGRTTAEFTQFDMSSSKVTFNGHTLTGLTNNTLLWTANTITCYGETINA